VRLVVDTDVLIAGIRSPGGASAALLVLLLERRATMLLSVSMAFEYEATSLRPEHLRAAAADEAEVRNLLNAIMDVVEPIEIHYLWRPALSDPNDDMILEAAVNGHADAIVTFNRKDYGDIPARFGIAVLSPADALRRIQR
jgi:putative PIN family toxin of toxin-antitoxin system